MKKLIILVLLFGIVCATMVEAQERSGDTYIISGQVVDSLSNEPVPFATVSVAFEQTPTQYLNAVASDGDGRFELQLRMPGEYIMAVQSVGVSTLLKPFTLTEDNRRINFGRILVRGDSQAIGEVTVVAQRPLVTMEIDKLIYNMEDDPESRVNNTLDMLRKVPMITVDGEENIQLRGATNFRIYLNGKPSNMLSGQNASQVLKSMPANTIRRIEVITDPGARYDAEGVGGIINIITSRNMFQGYQGSVSANASTFGGFGGNTFITAKTGKLGLTGNIGYNNFRRPWSTNDNTNRTFINDELHLREENSGRSRGQGNFLNGRLELSYDIDTLNLLTVGVNNWGGSQKFRSRRFTKMFDTEEDDDGMLFSYRRNGDGSYSWGSTGANIDYQRTARKKDENFTFSYRYSNSPDDESNSSFVHNITGVLPPYVRLDQRFDNNARTTEHSGQIDYVNPLTPAHTIETGIKYIRRENISKVNQEVLNENDKWVPLINYNNDFAHTSNIYAAYAGYAYRSQKVGIRAGLRAEGTQQKVTFKLDETKNFEPDNYFNVVPSVTFSYQLNPTQQLRVGYNMRISRPSIWFLNPFVNDTDPYNISYGNPNLVPEKSHGFNLNYSRFTPKLTLNASASYTFVNNSIQRYTFLNEDEPDVLRQTFGNIGSNHRAGIFVNAGWTPNRTFRFNLNSGLNYVDMNSAELNISNSGLAGNANISAQVTLPKDFRINANAMYFSGGIMLQGTYSGYYFTNISVNKDFMNRKLTVSLSCSNPFNKYLSMESSTSDKSFSSNSTNQQPMREGRLSVSFRFGAMTESIRRVQRSITNDDVLGGEGGGGGAGGGGGGGTQ